MDGTDNLIMFLLLITCFELCVCWKIREFAKILFIVVILKLNKNKNYLKNISKKDILLIVLLFVRDLIVWLGIFYTIFYLFWVLNNQTMLVVGSLSVIFVISAETYFEIFVEKIFKEDIEKEIYNSFKEFKLENNLHRIER